MRHSQVRLRETRLWGVERMLILFLIILFFVAIFTFTGLGPLLIALMHNARQKRRH